MSATPQRWSGPRHSILANVWRLLQQHFLIPQSLLAIYSNNQRKELREKYALRLLRIYFLLQANVVVKSQKSQKDALLDQLKNAVEAFRRG